MNHYLLSLQQRIKTENIEDISSVIPTINIGDMVIEDAITPMAVIKELKRIMISNAFKTKLVFARLKNSDIHSPPNEVIIY